MVAGITGLVEPAKVQESMAGVADGADEESLVEQSGAPLGSPVSEDEPDQDEGDQLDDDDDDEDDGVDAPAPVSPEETEEADEFEDFDDDDFDDEFDDDFEEELDEDYDANEDNFGDDFDSNGVDFPGDDSFGKPAGGTPGGTDKPDEKSTD